jgi:hypothetical protein
LTERKINTKTVKRINIKIMRQTIARTMKMKRERRGLRLARSTERGQILG